MSEKMPVTLQINLAPTDLPHATHILPHQLRQWGGQVDEILFNVDLHRSRGKFGEGWQARLPGLRRLIHECCARYPHARSVDVDYSEESQQAVAAAYGLRRRIPIKDYRGAPFYAYLSALNAAQNDLVFHLDSDILFGGGSQTWIGEALAVLASRPEVLACNPLPGPPTPDATLRSQVLEREPMTSQAFRSPGLSTRLFVLDRRRLCDLPMQRPSLRRSLGAWADGNPRLETAERSISDLMAREAWVRVDFLGQDPGMWAIHPPYRSATFYERLPALIDEIERGDIPDGQRGHHDVEDCLVDWTSVRPSHRGQVGTHLRLLRQRIRPNSVAIER
jgi:hypothetical protein